MVAASRGSEAWGILGGYEDVNKRWHDAPSGTVAALLSALGATPRSGPPTGAETGGPGARPVRPVRPATCHLPSGLRTWGWTVQLYALRSARSWGVGDLGDLARLAAWSCRAGAGVMLVNPLHAPLPSLPQEPSPYFPSSRRFRNPLYLQVEAVPGWDRLASELEPLARAGRDLNGSRLLKRDAAMRLKLQALERLWSVFSGSDDFERFRLDSGPGLRDYATFCALAEVHGAPWRSWPGGLRHPDAPDVARFGRERAGRVGFHAWLQWQIDRQLAAAGRHAGLVTDLAIGVDPNGADAWTYQDLILPGFTVGAPPDPFSLSGQNWQLAAWDPWRLAERGFAPLIETLRAGLAHAAGMRIDHAMGLWRLFLIPEGGTPAEGVYLRNPSEELLAVVARESRRARAFVIGEDLGTVQPEVRRELVRRNVLGYRLIWFENRPPSRYPARSLAAVSTHDLPTLAGVVSGLDAEPSLSRRLHRYAGVRPGTDPALAARLAYAALGASPSAVVAASLEDALGVVERPNRPGTSGPDAPNWSLGLPLSLEQIEVAEGPASLAAVIADGRARE